MVKAILFIYDNFLLPLFNRFGIPSYLLKKYLSYILKNVTTLEELQEWEEKVRKACNGKTKAEVEACCPTTHIGRHLKDP